MKKTLLLVLVILFGFSISTFSQQYNFVNYSIEDGLAQSQVRALCQDNDGYLWIGTLGGVSKFDGIKFTNYSTEDGLLTNQANSIYKTKQGDIWIGGKGGISKFNGLDFESYKFINDLGNNSVLSIAEDKNGNLWMGTDGGGVVFYDHEKFNYFNLINGAKHNYIRNIFCDNNNNLWFSTRNGITVIDENNVITDTIQNVNATQVLVEKDGTLWCSTYSDGVLKITNDTTIKYTKELGLIDNSIRGLEKRKDGTFWFISKSGISKFDGQEFKKFTSKDGLTNNNLKCIREGNDGVLFLGSDGGGLIKFTSENFISYGTNDGLSSELIMSVTEDNNNNLWFSTYGEGVCTSNSKTYKHYKEKDGLGNNTVWCSFKDSKNQLWFGTSGGLSLFDGEKIKTYNKKNGLNAQKIYAINEDNNGNIWIGTKKGLSVLITSNDSIYNYSEIKGLSRNIRDIYRENDETVWFCSSDGLFKYNIKKHNAEKYGIDNGLPSNSVMTILKDNNNILWLGTTNGLVYIENGNFFPIKLPGNYAANYINFLNIDKNNHLWIGTNFGLYEVDASLKKNIKDINFVRYTNLDGLKSLECNQNSSFIDSKNNLWFGTSRGLMKHPLTTKKDTVFSPKIHLTDIRLFYEKQNWKNYTKKIPEGSTIPDHLSLNHNKNHLTFDFVGIHHLSPDKIRYRFKLEGFDEDWQPITTANFVTYSNIPFGDYVFTLSATADMENWATPVQFNFTIKTPFWFTWWFYLLVIFSIAGIIWLIILRTKKIEQEKKETEAIVNNSKMMVLEQQALNASMNRHFIFNSLNSIQYYINRQDKISANRYLSSFAKLVRKNLDSSLVNEVYIDEELERIALYLKLEQMRFQDKFTYDVDMDINIEYHTIKIPSMLLQPFIENSIWHGILPLEKPGHIELTITKKEDQLVINIIDNGIGIDNSLNLKKDKVQHHESKGMQLTKGRIDLMSKISNKECYIEGPTQLYDKKRKSIGTKVSIVIGL